MKANLIKEKKSFTDSNGKARFTFNYFLVFENGQKVAIVARYYDTENIKDQQTKEHLTRANVVNATLLGAFADLVEDEKQKNK